MTLTTSLLTDIRSDVASRIQTLFTHGAVGDDNTSPAASDTALGNEQFRDARDEFDNPGGGVITATLHVLSTENNGNNIKESGWFDDAAAGTMYVRNTLTSISKTADIQVFLDTEITITVEEV